MMDAGESVRVCVCCEDEEETSSSIPSTTPLGTAKVSSCGVAVLLRINEEECSLILLILLFSLLLEDGEEEGEGEGRIRVMILEINCCAKEGVGVTFIGKL